MSNLYLTRRQSRQVDAIAENDYKIPGLVLMENAGRGVVDALIDYGIYGPITICCGKGNNAGDGFVAARHLMLRGHRPSVWLFTSPDDLTGDAAANYEIAYRCHIPMIEFQSDLWGTFEAQLHISDWVVDALLGTGAQGNPREPLAGAITRINRIAKKVLAVDLPSGLDADTGEPAHPTIRATLTCTFFANKIGLSKISAEPYVGEIEVCDIGFPPQLVKQRK